ncbi:MAG: hypothetical protein AABO41_26410 [Acidobacteriota bacterium]
MADLSLVKAEELSSAALPAVDARGVESVEQMVYIDHSLSMAGFVGHPNSGFEEFVDSMPDVLPGCRLFVYGQSRGQGPSDSLARPAEFDRHIHEAAQYRLGFNPDDVLVNALASDERPVFSIIVTDGVESDSDGTINTRVVDGIRKWLSGGRTFAVLRMKSLFLGDFYSERARRMIGPVTAPSRPFYAFVFSPGLTEFNDLLTKLRKRIRDIQAIVFSPDSIRCSVRFPEQFDGFYDSKGSPTTAFYWQMLIRKSLDAPAEELSYRFDYEIAPDYPVKRLRLQLEVNLFRWEAKNFQSEGLRVDTSRDSTLITELTEERDGAVVNGFSIKPKPFLTKDFGSRNEFYSIGQLLKVVEIDDGIIEDSTRDDADAANAGKTYRFQELITTLVEVHTKEVVGPRICPRFYLTVANR